MNKMMQQFHAIFGVFMVFFYFGVGIFLLFFAKMFTIDKAVRVIVGSAFLFYGAYRVTVAYRQIVDAFFSKEDDQD